MKGQAMAYFRIIFRSEQERETVYELMNATGASMHDLMLGAIQHIIGIDESIYDYDKVFTTGNQYSALYIEKRTVYLPTMLTRFRVDEPERKTLHAFREGIAPKMHNNDMMRMVLFILGIDPEEGVTERVWTTGLKLLPAINKIRQKRKLKYEAS
jgi:hypothetical protein